MLHIQSAPAAAGEGEAAAASVPRGTQLEEVTGPASPLALLLSHAVDAARGAVTVHCRLQNRTMEEVRGIEVGRCY